MRSLGFCVVIFSSGNIFWAPLKRCDKVAAGRGLWLGMAGIVGCFRLQSPFWSCRGQTFVSPPCVSHITSTNTSKQAGLEIIKSVKGEVSGLPVTVAARQECNIWKTSPASFALLIFLFHIHVEEFCGGGKHVERHLWSLSSCALSALRQCECRVCVGGGGVRSRAGQSQQEGPDLDMVVKFHWLKRGGRFIGCYL